MPCYRTEDGECVWDDDPIFPAPTCSPQEYCEPEGPAATASPVASEPEVCRSSDPPASYMPEPSEGQAAYRPAPEDALAGPALEEAKREDYCNIHSYGREAEHLACMAHWADAPAFPRLPPKGQPAGSANEPNRPGISGDGPAPSWSMPPDIDVP